MKRALQVAIALFVALPAFSEMTRQPERVGLSRRNTQLAQRYASADAGTESPERVIRLKLLLNPGPDRQRDLSTLLAEQLTPGHPNFHAWLSPAEFAQRFGASDSTVQRAMKWLAESEMADVRLSPNRRSISFSASISQASSAFQTEIHSFDVGGMRHFSNLTTPVIPESLAGSVTDIVGLHDFGPLPTLAADPHLATATDGNVLGPDDLSTIYNVKALHSNAIDGTGVTIAIPGIASIDTADLQSFRAKFGLPALNLEIANVPGNRSTLGPSLYSLEATLDLEIAGAVAHRSKLVYVLSGDVLASVQHIIDYRLADIISYSYAQCETDGDGSLATYIRAMAQQASAEGITWIAASGDTGAAGCDQDTLAASHGLAVTIPASVPEVTAVGGTVFNDHPGQYWAPANNSSLGNALSYIPENAWSSADQSGIGVIGGGGGFSSYFARPRFQDGFGEPAITRRMVPDVSFAAAVPYSIFYRGSSQLVAGTSAATPLFAGILALTQHYVVSNGLIAHTGLGDINPTLYALNQSVPSAFHDVVSGNNHVACSVGTPDCTTGIMGWSAGPGYDMATGLGSVDAYTFATNWWSAAQQSQASVSTITTLTTAPSTLTLGDVVTLIASVTSTSSAIPSGTVTFTRGSTALGTASLIHGKATLENVAITQDNGFAVGSDPVLAAYKADTPFADSQAETTVTVDVPSYAITPSQTSVSAGSNVVLTLSSGGYAGAVTFTTTVSASDGVVTSILASAPPTTLTYGGTGVSVLSIRSNTSALNQRRSKTVQGAFFSSLGMIATGSLFGIRRKLIPAILLIILTIVGTAFLVACGTGGVAAQRSTASVRSCLVTVTPHGSGLVKDPSPVTITVTLQ